MIRAYGMGSALVLHDGAMHAALTGDALQAHWPC